MVHFFFPQFLFRDIRGKSENLRPFLRMIGCIPKLKNQTLCFKKRFLIMSEQHLCIFLEHNCSGSHLRLDTKYHPYATKAEKYRYPYGAIPCIKIFVFFTLSILKHTHTPLFHLSPPHIPHTNLADIVYPPASHATLLVLTKDSCSLSSHVLTA